MGRRAIVGGELHSFFKGCNGLVKTEGFESLKKQYGEVVDSYPNSVLFSCKLRTLLITAAKLTRSLINQANFLVLKNKIQLSFT